MTKTQIIDVLIIGTGPVGLTLACDLARRSLACRIIDQDAIYHTGRAGGLSPRPQEIFEDFGLLEQIASYNAPIPWRFYDRSNQIIREIDPAASPLSATPDTPYPATLHVGQQEIEMVLRKYLASHGRHVELDCQLIDFKEHPDHIVAFVQRAGRSEVIQARYLIGCDGGHSTVRKGAGISFEGETKPNAYTLAGVIRVSELAPTYFASLPQVGRRSGSLTSFEGRTSRCWCSATNLYHHGSTSLPICCASMPSSTQAAHPRSLAIR